MSFFLFPGQGSQQPGMGKDFLEQSPAARRIFERARPLLPEGFLDTVFDGGQSDLNETRIAQPALLTVEVAIAAHLEHAGIRPEGCAGHSLGEIPALVVAGACAFEDALRFTRERARLMSEDVPEGGMLAVFGMALKAVEAHLPEGAGIANENGPAQTIVSGTAAALEAAAAALKEAGAQRVMPLRVSGPFHSVYMRGAAEQFAETLREVPFQTPSVRFISSVTGGDVSSPEEIRRLLGQQLCQPVRWAQVMAAAGAGDALEIGPGGVLRGLARRIDGAPAVTRVGTMEQAAALLDDC